MRRLIVVIAASMALSGCASFSSDMFGSFRSAPPPVTIQLESLPPGADAVTSLGPGCKTPCSVSVPATPNFTVTFSAPRFQPVTVPISVIVNPGDFTSPASTTVDPNPVIAELPPLGPPPRRVLKRAPPKKQAARPVGPPTAAAAPAAGSPFPQPIR